MHRGEICGLNVNITKEERSQINTFQLRKLENKSNLNPNQVEEKK